MNAEHHYEPGRGWLKTDRPLQPAKPFIPTAILTELIAPILEYTTYDALAKRSGVGHRVIFDISHQRTQLTRFATADKIISLGLGMPNLWQEHPGLREACGGTP